ncbi:lysophospholipid acyltransferase [Pseudonocardia spinosispora]|uniref:lysophospholipid acyltransferase n=1 Tax=Pseudonocardia spinosispora TaxID=103441 RepID=UPI000411F6EC|nr:lysophospholipid acyltransferase [Pseudonocardia spinosispora]
MQVDPAAFRDGAATLLGRTPARGVLRRASLLPPSDQAQPGDTREVKQLLSSEQFRDSVGKLAKDAGISEHDALVEAGDYLREMSATHHARVTDVWQRFGNWMTRGYDVLVDEDGLAEMRRLDRKHALIFLISHRSYLDEFIMPPTLEAGGLSPLFGMAGANLNFFPFGTIARRTGIIHVRRSTGDIPIYRLALRSFVGQLVANKSNLCWSIEGGRSRTGKLRPPRYGLLRYVADAVEELDDTDPLLIPVSFMYDQLPVHEVGKMASEARGAGKEAEDVRWLVGYARGLRERLGRVYLDFGTPLPLRQRLEELRADEVTENQVERVALDVCHRLNEATPVTPTAAVCFALLAADRALTLDEVIATAAPLAQYIEGRGWPVAGGANLHDRSTLRWALRELVRSGVLTSYSGGSETVWGIGDDQHLIAAVYRNSAIHVFLVRAIAELALQAVAETDSDPGDKAATILSDEALRLRELLKFDFFFAQRDQFTEELHTELAILANPTDHTPAKSGTEVTKERALEWLATARPLVAHLVLRPFLDAYRVVGEQLAALDEEEPVDQKALINSCLRVGHQWTLQRTLASEESVSGEMFSTALKLAGHRGLIKSDAPHLGKRRREFADELREVAHAIGRIAGRDRALRGDVI